MMGILDKSTRRHRPEQRGQGLASGLLWALMGLSSISACAEGNWRHYRATRYERAEEDERSVRPKTYDLLVELQKLQDKGDAKKALRVIEAYEDQVKDVPYEKALLAQAKAYLLMGQEKFVEAIPAIESALVDELLPEETETNLWYNLAQIQYQKQNYPKAQEALESWMALNNTPAAHDLALMGHIYYQQKDFRRAVAVMKKALQKRPDETSWRQLILSVYYEQKDWPNAREVLLTLLEKEPGNKSYWDALASLELELKRTEYGLATLEVGSLLQNSDADERMRVAILNLNLQAPQRSVQMLQTWLQEGSIPKSAKNWELLGNAQAMARDLEGACDSLAKARKQSTGSQKKAALTLRIAEIYLHLGQWAKAMEYGKWAAEAEAAEVAQRGYLVLGVARYQEGDFGGSVQALQRASQGGGDKERLTRNSARQWLQLVMSQRAYHEELLALGNEVAKRGKDTTSAPSSVATNQRASVHESSDSSKVKAAGLSLSLKNGI